MSGVLFALVTPRGTQDLSSPIRDQTCTPCSGSTESQPLDHQGSSKETQRDVNTHCSGIKSPCTEVECSVKCKAQFTNSINGKFLTGPRNSHLAPRPPNKLCFWPSQPEWLPGWFRRGFPYIHHAPGTQNTNHHRGKNGFQLPSMLEFTLKVNVK